MVSLPPAAPRVRETKLHHAGPKGNEAAKGGRPGDAMVIARSAAEGCQLGITITPPGHPPRRLHNPTGRARGVTASPARPRPLRKACRAKPARREPSAPRPAPEPGPGPPAPKPARARPPRTACQGPPPHAHPAAQPAAAACGPAAAPGSKIRARNGQDPHSGMTCQGTGARGPRDPEAERPRPPR